MTVGARLVIVSASRRRCRAPLGRSLLGLRRKRRGQESQHRHPSGILTANLEHLLAPKVGDRASRGDHLRVFATKDRRNLFDIEHQVRLAMAVSRK